MNIYIKKVTRSLGAFRKYLNITKLKLGLYSSHTTLYGRPASHAFLIYIFTYPAYYINFIYKKVRVAWELLENILIQLIKKYIKCTIAINYIFSGISIAKTLSNNLLT